MAVSEDTVLVLGFALQRTNNSLGDRQLAAQFQEIPLDLRMVEADE
ncbi:hypothetical protein CCACVL1_15555 [Corchorus capsularis]|uniref:Uncharacterized protein n=1 Tax=Corchorus capsularis TaxID=210143 RepID=A0A1R3I1R0_COCAP|nr:hypothetical protein CCACVL1_15555 [Corchorus capsularis]